MPRLTHDEEGKVYACPTCNESAPWKRTAKNTEHAHESTYVCYACEDGFEEPVVRDAKTPTKGGRDADGIPSAAPSNIREKILALRDSD